MTDATTRIKNLSIALANVSDTTHKDISYLIRELIFLEANAYKEKKGRKKTARPAATTPNDDIPF